MSRLSRRKFLKGSLTAAGSAFVIGGSKASGRELGANDRIRIAIAGIHSRGGSHINAFSGMDGVEIAYLVDPDTRLFGGRTKEVQDKSKGRSDPECVQDIRRVLDDKSVDAVSIATPNHWHSLMTIWACQAGKGVYVEKPMSHNVHEGRIAVEVARKHGSIVQHGTQRRSERGWAHAMAAIKSGKLGKLKVARGYCCKPRGSIGFKEHKAPPSELDWNLWLGPAPDQPYHENLVHYNWHWFWDTGNGDIGNQGVHQMDIGHWGIPGATLPKSVISFGGRFGYKDQGQTANTQVALMDFGETLFVFEVRGLKTPRKVANEFFLEHGRIVEAKWYPNDGDGKAAPLPDVEFDLGPGRGNFGNFIAAMRSRKQSDLNAPILAAHYSSVLGHLANVSYRLGEKVPFNPRTKAFGDDKNACQELERMEEHLKDNGVKLSETKCQVGRRLEVDARAEKIVGDAEANKMLTRRYRKPFAVPDKA